MNHKCLEIKENVFSLYSQLDCRIKAWESGYRLLGDKLYCGKGCRNCCTLAVNCTFPEAFYIAGSLTPPLEYRLHAHIKRLKSMLSQVTGLKSYLDLHRKELGSCPFLEEDGSCGIYNSRPFSCRSLISTKESRWCAQDFSSLDSSEKHEFMNSLNRSVVAFPMHYVAATQEMAQDMEKLTAISMHDWFGFSLYGNLPVLVFMENRHRLSDELNKGIRVVKDLFALEGLYHPFLAMLTDGHRETVQK